MSGVGGTAEQQDVRSDFGMRRSAFGAAAYSRGECYRPSEKESDLDVDDIRRCGHRVIHGGLDDSIAWYCSQMDVWAVGYA